MKDKPDIKEISKRFKENITKLKTAPAKPAPKPGKEEDGITIKSSTPGSNKRFKITVDDNGVISTVEVK